MQEQQGNLEEPLSDLPGPRWDDPFKKGKRMKNNNNNKVDEIVAKTAEALGTGKAFGGWTDKVEQTVKQGPPIKIKLGKGRKIGSRVADIGPGGKEYNVKTDAEWDKQNKDKSGTMKGLMTPKQKGTKVGVLSHVEHDGEFLDEASTTAKPTSKPTSSELKMARYRAKWKPKNLKKSAESSGMDRTITAGVETDGNLLNEAEKEKSSTYKPHGIKSDPAYKKAKTKKEILKAREQWNLRNPMDLWVGEDTVATPPRQRQLKDKKKEMLVHDSKGKVTTIDKKDLEQYQKDNPGGGVAEGVGSIGGAVREGWKGAVAGAGLGLVGGPMGALIGGLLGYAAGDAVGAIGRSVIGAEKKKTFQNKQR